MVFRNYDPERDRDAVHRIWLETSWLEKGKEEQMDVFVGSTKALVAELNGEAETLVLSTPGTLHYLGKDMPAAGITGVTTSRIARKQGFASRLTARSIAANADEGALVVGLGMFDQGLFSQMDTGGKHINMELPSFCGDPGYRIADGMHNPFRSGGRWKRRPEIREPAPFL